MVGEIYKNGSIQYAISRLQSRGIGDLKPAILLTYLNFTPSNSLFYQPKQVELERCKI